MNWIDLAQRRLEDKIKMFLQEVGWGHKLD